METGKCVAVTHFINPHLFWYKTIETNQQHVRVVSILEERLSELYKNKPASDNFLRPQVGDKVAVNFVAWNKYIRAEILQIAEFQHEHYILWAIDYGFPLLTKKEYIRSLPTRYQIDIDIIQVGGIANIYPAEQEYDDMEGNLVMVRKDSWLQNACNMLEKLLADANSINFHTRYQTENGHMWGDLIIVNHKGIEINALDYLLKTINAVEENEISFKQSCSKLKTTKIAKWLTNDRNSKMKTNNIQHNYIEHSQQINATLIDENAKRKVEDWQLRNERKKFESTNDIVEASSDMYEGSVDDVTFDDSASAIHDRQVNYIGKAGILTKIKQQKYPSEKELPPAVHPTSFEIDNMLIDQNIPKKDSKHSHSSHSGSVFDSQIEKLLDMDITDEVTCPLIDLESTTSSTKNRQKILLEMRKNTARGQKESKSESHLRKHVSNQNETTISQSRSLDSYSYQPLEKQSVSSSSNNTTIDKDDKSEISVKNARVKHLIAMRKKLAASSSIQSNSDSSVITTNEEEPSFQPQQNNNSLLDKSDILNFELKPRIIPKSDGTIGRLNPISSISKVASKNTIKENLKMSEGGFDNFTMVPAGFDITRLQTYNDENNHWHRKKSTRNDCVPHCQNSSTEDIHRITTQDNSFSSSSQNSKGETDRITFSNNANIRKDANMKISSKAAEIKSHDGNTFSNELSISLNSPLPSHKLRKRRQLKSPTSQLSKIDKILQEHNIERDLGNSNILNVKLLNTSVSSQKSLLTNTSSNISCINKNITTKSPPSPNNNHKSVSLSTSLASNSRNNKVHNEFCDFDALVDVKNTEYLPIVEGESKVQTKFIEHLVLAHSSIRLSPIENISDAPFLPEIHEEMRQMRVNKVYRIQVYSWSHVLRNNSLFVVNPSRTGKTWSYLPPLCSLLCCRKDTFKPSFGPVAIILVASLKHVEMVNNYCRRLMSGFRAEAPTCVPSYGMRNLIETKIQLLNGCGILIATPSNVLRLLHENDFENENLLDPERLQHIVIDDMDIMMSRAQHDFEKACRILFKMAKKSKLKKLSPQLIVTSRDWDGIMVKLIQNANQPLLLMGDFLEAAVYGHSKLSVKLKPSSEKNKTILKFINERSESPQGWDNRTLILCNEDEDVENVYKYLRDHGRPCLLCYSRSTESERVTIDEWKRKVSSQILICTDACFCELKIQNVNNLIHYSLPPSWTQFTLRFSAFARTYNNYVCCFEYNILSTSQTVTKNYAHSLILLDENNNLQLPRLVDFMRKHNQKVQDEIQAVSKRVLIMREEERILNTSLLCPQLLEFGECDEVRCDYRHELTRFDFVKKCDDIPRSGEIRIHVLKVFSPTHYAVRLLQHKPYNAKKWVEIRRSNEALTFSVQINMHYHNENNLFLHWPPHVNDLCIYQYAENFRRARILEAPTFDQTGTNIVQSNLKVTLKLIDDGIIIGSVKCNEIFVCDDKFKDFPSQAVDVRLMKVVPFDNERTWDSKTTKQVQKWIMEEIESNYLVQANIDCSLINTIWVNNLIVLEKLSGIDAYCPIVDLKKSLVKKNFAVLYKGDRKHVRDLIDEYSLLNPTEFDINNGDSDLDYKSCKNESIDLIKFSSSNDSSMESAVAGLEPIKKMEGQIIDVEGTKEDTIPNIVEVGKSADSESDWDDHLDSGPQISEVHNPLQKERWSHLPLNELVKVEIGDEGENGNWENIFVQVIDKNSTLLFEKLNQLIIKHVEQIKADKMEQNKIYDFDLLRNCIVKYNNLYLRAKVYGLYGEKIEQRLYRFFLCDYGCFTNVKSEELYNDFLYETTEEIVNFTPYQAIHCTLAGIKWDRFTKRYQVTKDYLYACAVLEIDGKEKNALDLCNLQIKSYKILLYECEIESDFDNAILFNKTLIDSGITMYDEGTKQFLEYEIDMLDNEKNKMSSTANNNTLEQVADSRKTYNKDEVFTYEQLMDFLKSDNYDNMFADLLSEKESKPETNSLQNNNRNNLINQETFAADTENNNQLKESSKQIKDKEKFKEISKVSTSESENDEQGHCTSYSNSSMKSSISLISTDSSKRSKSERTPERPPQLKSLNKRPQTTWYQNDFIIFISIYAPDIKDYQLEVTSKYVLFTADINCEKSVLILNLLGSIEPESVSHEIKGLSVVLRLKKIVFLKWPRLLRERTKYVWLKYNFNAFDSIEMDCIMPQRHLHTMLDNELNFKCQQTDNYNSDEDTECELYQTYNPIQNNDDVCDPFSSGF